MPLRGFGLYRFYLLYVCTFYRSFRVYKVSAYIGGLGCVDLLHTSIAYIRLHKVCVYRVYRCTGFENQPRCYNAI